MRTGSEPSRQRAQKVARVIDREVGPVWHDRFARMIYRDLVPTDGLILDVHSGSGQTTLQLLNRMDESSRIVAVQGDETLANLLRMRLPAAAKQRVYVKEGNFDDVTVMESDTYDAAVANLVLGQSVKDWTSGLGELHRVVKPDGQVYATFALRGTWTELVDLLEEVLRAEGLPKAARDLRWFDRQRPRPQDLSTALRGQGLGSSDFVVEHERFQLLFRSGRECLFSPLVEQGRMRLWKALITKHGGDPNRVFWLLKEAIDTYFAGHVFAVTVVAGLVRIQKPGARAGLLTHSYWARYPGLSAVFDGQRALTLPSPEAVPVTRSQAINLAEEDDMDFDISFEEETELLEPQQLEDATPDPVASAPSQSLIDADESVVGVAGLLVQDDDLDAESFSLLLDGDKSVEATAGPSSVPAPEATAPAPAPTPAPAVPAADLADLDDPFAGAPEVPPGPTTGSHKALGGVPLAELDDDEATTPVAVPPEVPPEPSSRRPIPPPPGPAPGRAKAKSSSKNSVTDLKAKLAKLGTKKKK